ncbi:hypothetical protein NWF32_03860 [Pseudomonas qingdaonensis]|nr:hypothetical protein [Pseudomonas qingdaonensis]
MQHDLSQDGLTGDVRVGAVSTALTGVLPGLIEASGAIGAGAQAADHPG